MNSIVKAAQTGQPSRFLRQLSSAETEYQRARGTFGYDSAEAMAAWHLWQSMKQMLQAHEPGLREHAL